MTERTAAPRRGGAARSALWVEALVLVAALVPRLGFVLDRTWLRGTYGYDPSVYYAASDALLQGRLPYRDFVLLHPPGIALVLAPFAELGRLTSDNTGYLTANVAFAVLGAVNAVLVVRIARRFGAGARGALLGGLFYAVWFGAVHAEYLIRLEPLGNFFLLCGLLSLTVGERLPARRWWLLSGFFLGAAAGVKIWWILPLLVVLGWHLARRRRVAAACSAAGAAAALVVINGPFFLAAPRAMWSMVVADQIGRARPPGVLTRLSGIVGIDQVGPGLPRVLVAAAVLLAAVSIVLACACAWRSRLGTLLVVLTVAQLVLLVAAPSWYVYYADFLAPVLALTIAAATRVRDTHAPPEQSRTRAPEQSRTRAAGTARVLVAAVVVAAVGIGIYSPPQSGRPFPGRTMARAVADVRCVMSDSPTPLIAMNVLTRDLANGCRNWVDVSGRTYGTDASATAKRKDNQRWQRDLRNYLFSGGAVTVYRWYNSGVGHGLGVTLRHALPLARLHGYNLFRTPARRARAHPSS